MSETADSTPPEPVRVRVSNAELKPTDLTGSDQELLVEAVQLTADVASSALIQTLVEHSSVHLDTPEAVATRLRPGLVDRIEVENHGWGSWEALLAVPPDAIVWAAHEVGVPIGAAIAVRIGELGLHDLTERVLNRLRTGTVDTELIEITHRERRFDLDILFPQGTVLRVRRTTIHRKERTRSLQKQAEHHIAPGVKRRKRRGKRGRLK